MSDKKFDSHAFSDLERQHPVVADSIGNGQEAEPLAVRLGDLWSDFIRVADEARDLDAPKKASAVVPLLDDMKGILQWD
ncbi:MAG TPA: hypothetical protein VJS39_14520 [Gemmatimonadaceae bacterium]|nr:hypothetical protein [Gemmatimonadaceae bacterium]